MDELLLYGLLCHKTLVMVLLFNMYTVLKYEKLYTYYLLLIIHRYLSATYKYKANDLHYEVHQHIMLLWGHARLYIVCSLTDFTPTDGITVLILLCTVYLHV
jgi:hypothetical protein